MEHREVVARRRMVRRYSGEPISRDTLDRVVDAAHRGPSAGFAQGISVVVVTDPTTISELAELCGESVHVDKGLEPWLSTAAAHLVLCVEPSVYTSRYSEPDKDLSTLSVPWWWVDGGAALMLILLAAVDEGLAAGLHGGHRTDGVAELLEIPDDVEILGIVTIGHGAPDRRSASSQRGRRPDVIHFNRWGATD